MVGKKHFNWQIYFGLLLLLSGGLFLADQLVDFPLLNYFWPVLVIILGVTFFIGMLTAGQQGSGLAIPGCVVTTIGLLFLVQNTFGLWVTWSYAWALIIVSVGLGLLVMNIYLKRTVLRRVAGLLMGIGLTLFVVFGALFELIFEISGADVKSALFLGSGLILLGLFVVFSRSLFKKGEEKVNRPSGEMPSVDGASQAVKAAESAFSEGEMRSIDLSETFDGLRFESLGEVIVTQGDVCALKIEASDALMEKMDISVVNGDLRISLKSGIVDWHGLSWLKGEHKARYWVTMEAINRLALAGVGDLKVADMKGESLILDHAGAGVIRFDKVVVQNLRVKLGGLGEIQIQGETQKQSVEITGAGSYTAENLRSDIADVVLSGAGNAAVWAQEELNAKVSGAGNIKYKGQPKVSQSQSGVGRVEPL